MEPGNAAPTENRMSSLLPVIVSLISGVVVAAVIAVATLLGLGCSRWSVGAPLSDTGRETASIRMSIALFGAEISKGDRRTFSYRFYF